MSIEMQTKHNTVPKLELTNEKSSENPPAIVTPSRTERSRRFLMSFVQNPSTPKNAARRIAPERQASRKSISSSHSSQLMRWDFDAGLETNHLRQIDNLQTIFGILGAHSLLDIPFDTFNRFLNDIKAGYGEAPFYHNFTHAMDVTQTLFAMLHFMENNSKMIDDVEKVVTLIAALGHDIMHPGVSNHYIVVSKHPIALEYGDAAASDGTSSLPVKVWGVLERMHAAETRRIVMKYKLLSNLPEKSQLHLEKLMMACILNTDMAQHDGLLKHMHGLVSCQTSPLVSEDRNVLCSFFLHCADLSNAAKPWKTAERWAQLIMQEFFEQGQAEKQKDMPVSPNCDAMTTMIPELQIKFIKFAVLPCFIILQTIFPRAIEAVNFASENVKIWEAKRDSSLTLEQRVIIRAISAENQTSEWSKMQDHKDEGEASKRRKEWILAKRAVRHPIYIAVSALAAVYIVFEPDLRAIWMDKSDGHSFDSILVAMTVVATADVVLSSLADHRYFNGFYFWLDVFSLLSLLFEICCVGYKWNCLILPSMLQPRMIRIGRLIRMAHFLPIYLLRLLLCSTNEASSVSTSSDVDESNSTIVFQRRDIFKLFSRLATKSAENIDPAAMGELVSEAYNGVDVPENATQNVLAYFSPSVTNTSNSMKYGISKESFSHGIRQMELKHDGAPDVLIDPQSQSVERMVGRELSDIVIKRILILVLVVLLIIPQLCWRHILDIDKYEYGLMDLHHYTLYSLTSESPPLPHLLDEIKTFGDTMQPIYLQVFNMSQSTVNQMMTNSSMRFEYYDSLSNITDRFSHDQVEGVLVLGCKGDKLTLAAYNGSHVTEPCASVAFFDLRPQNKRVAQYSIVSNSLILLCVVLSVLYQDYETYAIVIKPIKSMLSVVRQLAINPLAKIQVQPGEADNEILQLQNTLAKIASLIQIGFGEAGAEILAGNMLEGDLNPMVAGKKVHAIFGFCSIRNFPEATEMLKEEIMTFTNRIGEVVHESVHTFGGHANKNIGQAFLLVWKVPKTSIEFSIVSGSQVPQHMSPKKNALLGVLEADLANRQLGRLTIADKALMSFLKIQLDLFHSTALDEYQKVFLNNATGQTTIPMGFGLHVGWAIEGAIGSRYKIDASYLSPDVNMSARLEAATKQFGVTVLVSHTFHKLLSHQVQEMCRLIDCVTVKGSEKPLSLYTFDMCHMKQHKDMNLSTIHHLAQLQGGIPVEFRPLFDRGVNKYLEGSWQEATMLIQEAMHFRHLDGPSISLLRVMAEHKNQAPSSWRGYRALTEK